MGEFAYPKNIGICKKRHNKNKKLESGITIKSKVRPRKDGIELSPSVQQ